MLKIVCLLVGVSQAKLFDNRIITKVRHGIEKSMEYIDNNYERVNVDCLFGIVLSTALIADAYQNGTHIMDNSSLKMIEKALNILQKGMPLIEEERMWMAEYVLDYNIWYKSIRYKYDTLSPFSKIPDYQIVENTFNIQNDCLPDIDFCMKDIVNGTFNLKSQKCFINEYCWNRFYYYNERDSGYILTHKLLLLQLAKARKCQIDPEIYEMKTKYLCSRIYAETFNGDYFEVLDKMFDLFLEEIILCGYEGYTEFFQYKWLYFILKSQRTSGCFLATLDDNLKTRVRRDTNIFEDGCADHTTGLGVAVLSLMYNYIIKENLYQSP